MDGISAPFMLFIEIPNNNDESRNLSPDGKSLKAKQDMVTLKKKLPVLEDSPEVAPVSGGDYRCTSCAEDFDNKMIFDIHMSGHANKMKCAICNMILKSLKNYEKHCLRCKPYECQICGRIVRFRPNFIKHMRVHNGQQSQRLKYKCDVCNKEFMSFEYFKVHKKIHSENLNLTCKVCGKVFSAMASLRGHMKLHTGVQLHTCDICGKGFGQRYNLKIHSRVHTGVLPHVCSICDKKFHTESSYETHLQTFHKFTTTANESMQASPKNAPELMQALQIEGLPKTADSSTIIVKEEIDSSQLDPFENIPVKSRMKTITDFLASSSNSPPMYDIDDNLIECNDLSYSNIFDIDSVSQGVPANDSYFDERDVSFRSDSNSGDLQCTTTTTDGNFIRKEWVYSNYGGAKFDNDTHCRAASFIYD